MYTLGLKHLHSACKHTFPTYNPPESAEYQFQIHSESNPIIDAYLASMFLLFNFLLLQFISVYSVYLFQFILFIITTHSIYCFLICLFHGYSIYLFALFSLFQLFYFHNLILKEFQYRSWKIIPDNFTFVLH